MLSTLTRAYRVLARSLSSSATKTNAVFLRQAVHENSSPRSNAIFEPLEDRTLMSTYYVSPFGNDSNQGTTTGTAWKSINRVNSINLRAGDSVLFQGGQTFYGSLKFNSNDGGSASAYVTVSSYNGRATINSGTGDGAYALNTSGIDFSNLKFQGSPGGSTQYGVEFETTAANYKRPNVEVTNCEITGYTGAGILIMGDTGNAGFSNVQITGNSVHDNVNIGIETYAVTHNAIDNVYIANNQAYSNYGDGHSYVTGSGIELGGVNNAMVEHNVAYLNGWKGGNGGVGIWAYESNAVTFQYNQSYNNHGLRGHDGDGFDFDADTSNSIMQYNFAANNDGTGFQLDQWRNDSVFTNNTVRYNIAENNGQRNNYGSIEAWGKVLNSSFIDNTVYISPSKSGGSPSGMHAYNTTIAGLYVSGVTFQNNTIVATGGLRMVYVPGAETQGAKGLSFLGNTYDSSGSSVNLSYANKTYSSVSSFANSTGQEKVSGKLVGAQSSAVIAFPAFASPAASIAGSSSSTLVSGVNLTALFESTNLKNIYDKSIGK